MHSWVLHHLHIAILFDALMHLILVGCAVAAWVLFVRFCKIVIRQRIAPTYTLLSIMGAIILYMTYSVIASLFWCVAQYTTWWNR